jgi:hypothetical protein
MVGFGPKSGFDNDIEPTSIATTQPTTYARPSRDKKGERQRLAQMNAMHRVESPPQPATREDIDRLGMEIRKLRDLIASANDTAPQRTIESCADDWITGNKPSNNPENKKYLAQNADKITAAVIERLQARAQNSSDLTITAPNAAPKPGVRAPDPRRAAATAQKRHDEVMAYLNLHQAQGLHDYFMLDHKNPHAGVMMVAKATTAKPAHLVLTVTPGSVSMHDTSDASLAHGIRMAALHLGDTFTFGNEATDPAIQATNVRLIREMLADGKLVDHTGKKLKVITFNGKPVTATDPTLAAAQQTSTTSAAPSKVRIVPAPEGRERQRQRRGGPRAP